ncbi:hypothetical protein FRC04_000650 [Tulasnella sp. 424]|nr:hypothetical protein FRC04_000650 [Tulasnella sp. 424]KAG8974919.1 hypothetical protein FRC05_006596 [Tulasnella sp. 425]
MSHGGHGHTHDGTEGPGHTHGPPQQAMMPPPPQMDPLIQAALDEQFQAVPLAVQGDARDQAVCAKHSLEVCSDCGLNFAELNVFTKLIAQSNEIAIPPPPNVVHPNRSQAVQKTKEEGNTAYKQKNWLQAINFYNMSANIAASRNPWEPSALVRDEMAIVVCNRSAAFAAAEDYVSALVDADVVIQLKRPWSKGHFRKAKALVGLQRFEEARDAVMLGLQFEPDSAEMLAFKKEIEDQIEAQAAATRSPKLTSAPTPA